MSETSTTDTCPHCGAALRADASVCSACDTPVAGIETPAHGAAPQAPPAGDDAPAVPVPVPSAAPSSPSDANDEDDDTPGAADAPHPPLPRMSGFAIASLVMGLTWLFWIGSVLALVFGYLALNQLEQGERTNGRGLAIAGLVLGWMGVTVLVLMLIVSALGSSGSGG